MKINIWQYLLHFRLAEIAKMLSNLDINKHTNSYIILYTILKIKSFNLDVNLKEYFSKLTFQDFCEVK